MADTSPSTEEILAALDAEQRVRPDRPGRPRIRGHRLLAVPILGLALWALAWSIAAILQMGPRTDADRWEEQPLAANTEAWEYDWSKVQTARRIDPLDAEIPWLQGRLALLRVRDTTDTSSDARWLSRAEALFREALGHRPSWGLAYAYLARAYSHRLPQGREDFRWALDQAILFGPYEEAVQRQTIPLAFAHWDQLLDESRERLIRIVRHGIDHGGKGALFLMKAAITHHWEQHLLPLLRNDRQERRFRALQKKMARQGHR